MENNEIIYADIFDLPHHTSPKRPKMKCIDRAAQFAPFAALTGHDDAIAETARLTDAQIILDESEKEQIDQRLRCLLATRDLSPKVTVTYFVPDDKKSGGAYVDHTGIIDHFDRYRQTLVFADGIEICAGQVYAIDSEIFSAEGPGSASFGTDCNE